MSSRGLLLINLGTPASAEPEDVGKYLNEFLMDPWVIDIPYPLRWLLVKKLIVPRRKFKSSEAYKKIFTSEGSPLLANLIKLKKEVKNQVSSQNPFQVEIAMRYGQPSIASALKALSKCDQIAVLPLYPQFAESSTRSSIEKVQEEAKNLGVQDRLRVIGAFFDDIGFIESFAQVATENIEISQFQHFLFSFHGLPERHIKATDRSDDKNHCLAMNECCAQIVAANRDCYRAQCFSTAQHIAERLDLKPSQFSVSFQSRLGVRPWIKPYTDIVYKELVQRGVERLAVFCPSFVSDCLETTEEIGIRGKAQFLSLGGREFALVPSLNAHPRWASAILALANRYCPLP